MNTVVKQECLRLALGTTHFLLDLVSLVLPWDFQLCGGRIMLHISLDSRKASRAQKSQDTNGRILLPVSFNTTPERVLGQHGQEVRYPFTCASRPPSNASYARTAIQPQKSRGYNKLLTTMDSSLKAW